MLNRIYDSIINDIYKMNSYVHLQFAKKKEYFSVGNDGKLTTVQLNFIQRIWRRYWGSYPETHLKNVIVHWNNFQSKHGLVSSTINNHLAALWAKNHTKSILIQPPEAFFWGNSQVLEAEIIGICQLFSDVNNSKFCGKILSDNYREGDVILIEGVDKDVKISSLQDMQTAWLSRPADIFGWEPSGYAEQRDTVFETAIDIENQFQITSSILLRLVNNVNFLTNPSEFKFKIETDQQGLVNADSIESSQIVMVDKEKLWEKLLYAAMENFINALKKIEERFGNKNKSTILLEKDPLALSLLNLHKHFATFLQSHRHTQDSLVLTQQLKTVYEQFNAHLQKKKYTLNWTNEQELFYKKTWEARQTSLFNEIEKYRKLNKRVFVCAGAAHFFPNKGKSCSQVVELMVRNKFCFFIHNIEQNTNYYSFEDLSKKISALELSVKEKGRDN